MDGDPCIEPGCTKLRSRGYRRCRMHQQRIARHGDPTVVKRAGLPVGHAPTNWHGDDVTYKGLHLRLKYRRGRASDYPCACGCGEQAEDWAFDEPTGYSTDLSRYRPMKRSCHRQFDRV